MSHLRRTRARRWRHRRLLALTFLCLALSLGCDPDEDDEPPILQPGDPLANVETWRERFEETPADDPAAARAREVFARVREASGQDAELVVLEMGDRLVAFALADPAVVLSRAALDFCYRVQTPEQGDDRLAFLLGHELAHLKNGDFWHASAFATVQELRGEDEINEMLRAVLAENFRDRQKAEYRADDEGALALVMAGYDPATLFEEDRTFFEQWVQAVPGMLTYQDSGHPTPAERGHLLRARLREVAKRVHLFHEGVEAYQAGDYQRAVSLFRRFRRDFEGREVLNNLALSHLKLAAARLADCDGKLVSRYFLPEALDDETLAGRTNLRGGPARSSPCFEITEYRGHMDEAIELLETAANRERGYLPARLNQVAAFVLDEQYARAAVAGIEAKEIAPEDPGALGADALASLVYDAAGSGLGELQALNKLEYLHRRFPDDPGIAFNLASALSYEGRLEEARPVWEDFLRVEPDGAWAEIAKEWLGE
jgi:tetratricopeptide (TPR) repeat protein